MEEEDEREDMCERPLSLGWGRVGTGEEPCTSDVDAMVFFRLWWWRRWLNLRVSVVDGGLEANEKKSRGGR